MAERTVHQLTEDFNELVVRARERGVAMWATHHRSDFSSRRVADEQLAKLRVALGEAPPATIMPGTPPATIIPRRVLEVTLALPPDDIRVGPAVDWTATALSSNNMPLATHKSRASTWMIAMMLAVAHWRKTKALDPREPVTVTVELG